jgi:hypothetical protein
MSYLQSDRFPAKGLVEQYWRVYNGLRMLMLIHETAGTPRTGVSLERPEPCYDRVQRGIRFDLHRRG